MKRLFFPWLLLITTLISCQKINQNKGSSDEDSSSAKIVDVAEWGEFFDSAGVEGTFVLMDPRKDEWKYWNRNRADIRYTPASTFKIFSSIMALETGIRESPDDRYDWNGKESIIPMCNTGLTLKQAFQFSCVWYYQIIARGAGEETMQGFLNKFRYGNQKVGGPVDQLWLESPLKISANEQIEFLNRLQADSLPIKESTKEIMRDIMHHEINGTHVYSKTGWGRGDPDIGWLVGWVEKGDGLRIFALNIDMYERTDARKRQEIVEAIMKTEGFF